MNKNPRSSFPVNHGRRKTQGTLNLCKCERTKKEHYNNALGHHFSAGSSKNVTMQDLTKREYLLSTGETLIVREVK